MSDMKSAATKVDNRRESSKVASIIFNMFGSGSKRVKVEAEDENESSPKNTSSTAVSDIIALENKKASTPSSRGKFLILSQVFKKQFVIDGARRSRSLLLRRISAKRRAAKRAEEGSSGVDELCKRRILMGMKCKPVNASGKLHYGQDGVILHEE